MKLSRRSVLTAGAGTAALAAGAGCLSEPDGATDSEGGYAAFFALWDWAQHVSGDALEIENPIQTGEMGHGWEPPADLRRDIVSSNVFIYLDTAEFSWAQNVAADIEADGSDVTLIDAMDGLESSLIPAQSENGNREPDTDADYDPGDITITEFDIYNRRTDAEVAYWHGDANHWHGGLPEIPVDDYATVDGVFTDDEGRVLPLGEDDPFRIDARVTEGAADDVVEIESQGDHIVFHGLETGRTRVVFELVADGEVIWDTSADNMTAEVVDEPSVDDDSVPEFYDPHVWVDPVIAQQIVETIADGLAELDPDSASLYEENAAEYIDRLDAVDEQFETLADEATKEIAVLAGHDSFQYLETRYGFEIHTPTTISPDAEITTGDLANTIDLIDEQGIETILYDPFDATEGDVPREVDHLLENSQATEAEAISPTEGTTAEWNEQGWGWIEQMEELNLPALRQALEAE
ncbi:metal ABC transporter solute-binding protein, Zn/Mn family [Natrialba sp. SSL1]|uniref:metal ABC transporter solute-binding protein, Zn/Mn family n=1 Tax=Natrialba sp. SSL1 TaxID=1869245 RepID=UPI0008F808D1|nr:zinc ABC transporter substrate-binding protein [Natrialba sp. SSL1]OIB57895.1 zinc ABC transporter substrate-binding protein [Natrialba sp. SSL1]